uniref:C3H1-type domain-containing protein n=1 Tax=Clastoptera arizonana TaxID=38151 RepID=A0A1B6D1D1_9HEMI
MLPSKGFFNSLSCPYYDYEDCDRPHCHYKHNKKEKEKKQNFALPYNSALQETTYRSGERKYQIPPNVTYKPTPIAELKKRHIPVMYTPTKSSSVVVKKKSSEDSRATPIYIPSPIVHKKPDISYNPTPSLSSKTDPQFEKTIPESDKKSLKEKDCISSYSPSVESNKNALSSSVLQSNLSKCVSVQNEKPKSEYSESVNNSVGNIANGHKIDCVKFNSISDDINLLQEILEEDVDLDLDEDIKSELNKENKVVTKNIQSGTKDKTEPFLVSPDSNQVNKSNKKRKRSSSDKSKHDSLDAKKSKCVDKEKKASEKTSSKDKKHSKSRSHHHKSSHSHNCCKKHCHSGKSSSSNKTTEKKTTEKNSTEKKSNEKTDHKSSKHKHKKSSSSRHKDEGKKHQTDEKKKSDRKRKNSDDRQHSSKKRTKRSSQSSGKLKCSVSFSLRRLLRVIISTGCNYKINGLGQFEFWWKMCKVNIIKHFFNFT